MSRAYPGFPKRATTASNVGFSISRSIKSKPPNTRTSNDGQRELAGISTRFSLLVIPPEIVLTFISDAATAAAFCWIRLGGGGVRVVGDLQGGLVGSEERKKEEEKKREKGKELHTNLWHDGLHCLFDRLVIVKIAEHIL